MHGLVCYPTCLSYVSLLFSCVGMCSSENPVTVVAVCMSGRRFLYKCTSTNQVLDYGDI